MRRRVSVVMAAIALLVLAGAVPGIAGVKQQYRRAYNAVVQDHGKRAPGRDILKYGVIVGGGEPTVRPATRAELRRSYKVLFRMRHPAPVASAPASTPTGSTPTAAPTASSSSVAPSSGLAQCIVQRESGGNAQAVNPNGHYGIGQWDQSTWAAQGGTKYAASPLGASKGEQMQVLNDALAHGQSGAWTPYDGC